MQRSARACACPCFTTAVLCLGVYQIRPCRSAELSLAWLDARIICIQEPIGSQDLDEKAKNRHEKRVLDMVRDKVEAKPKNMAKVFRQLGENKDGDISYV